MKTHVVKKGECLASIALENGFRTWKTIYYHADNAELRRKRPNPNVLCAGDKVAIPAVATKEVSAASDKRHRFRAKGPSKWRLRVVIRDTAGNPTTGLAYKLEAGNVRLSGTTPNDGLIDTLLPADTEEALLEIAGERIRLTVGGLDPITRVTGVQQRLAQLGFDPGAIDGIVGPKTIGAVMAFQAAHPDLKPTGKIDDDTRRTLLAAHDNDSELKAAEEDMKPSSVEVEPASEQAGPHGAGEIEEVDIVLPDTWRPEDTLARLDSEDLAERIRAVQQRLRYLELDPGPIDGINGPRTTAAVVAFQEMCAECAGVVAGIVDAGPIDGIAGPKTRHALAVAAGR
jgi:N-acetylmuramoyl-L-alanine amidase